MVTALQNKDDKDTYKSQKKKIKGDCGIDSNLLKQKIQKLLDDGYEWDANRKIGVRKTEERISMKFN